jgi:UDP-N-acetylglucosamine/UDP-N-acetylgalactosamine 4-epimerase
MFKELQKRLIIEPKTWLITGAAGFIGSHLVEQLLRMRQRVIGVDNFVTGHERNIEAVIAGNDNAQRLFQFVRGDINDSGFCNKVCSGVDYVCHQAALGSVPRSIVSPKPSFETNVQGFLNMILASKDAGAKRFVYASSSSVYGDSSFLPKREGNEGAVLSPYAATKKCNELIAEAFSASYGVETVGLRYFNVFGPRQDPEGDYAAVVPRWIEKLLNGEKIKIFGDGLNSRDFCYVDNVVKANILAAAGPGSTPFNRGFNIACGERTSLNTLFDLIFDEVSKLVKLSATRKDYVEYVPERLGDIAHSHADISEARDALEYSADVYIGEGISRTVKAFASLSEKK